MLCEFQQCKSHLRVCVNLQSKACRLGFQTQPILRDVRSTETCRDSEQCTHVRVSRVLCSSVDSNEVK